MSDNDKFRVVQKLNRKRATIEYWPEFRKFGCWWSFENASSSESFNSFIYDTLEEACDFLSRQRKRNVFIEDHKHLHNTVVECPTCGFSTKIDLIKKL